MKLNKKDLRNLLEILDACECARQDAAGAWSACAPVDAWTTGSGRHTKPRALPAFSRRRDRGSAGGTCAEADALEAFWHGHPRRRAAIVVDLAAAAAALGAGEIVPTPANEALAAEALAVLRDVYADTPAC